MNEEGRRLDGEYRGTFIAIAWNTLSRLTQPRCFPILSLCPQVHTDGRPNRCLPYKQDESRASQNRPLIFYNSIIFNLFHIQPLHVQ